MKSKVRFRGKLRSYLCWPLWLTIPMTLADVGLYFYDVTAGIVRDRKHQFCGSTSDYNGNWSRSGLPGTAFFHRYK